jgi:hypothetical protein
MTYIFNPKTQGSGIIGCIPQTGRCPNECEDCFFQSGRSYLEPLDINLPNIPSTDNATGRIVRINDGNDSNVDRELVMRVGTSFPMRFYNTAIPNNLDSFDAPVVLTLNPGKLTDKKFHRVEHPPKNLMFVRIRTNTWNIDSVVNPAIQYYSLREVPIVLTFMAYYEEKPQMIGGEYMFRKRTINSYYAIRTDTWLRIMDDYRLNKWVYSCGKIEGEQGVSGCRFCGNCVREYFVTMERMRE